MMRTTAKQHDRRDLTALASRCSLGASLRRAWLLVGLVALAAAMGAPAAASALTPGHILVSDYRAFDGAGGLIEVNPLTGARATVSANDDPAGAPHFDGPVAVAFDAGGDILVAQQDSADVLRIDPDTGTRTTVSSGTVGTGPALAAPNGIAIEPDGSILVGDFLAFDDASGGVLRIDPATGDRTEVSSNARGTGPSFNSPAIIKLEPGGTILVVDTFVPAVFRVDPATGNRTAVTSTNPADLVGTGPDFEYPYDLELEPGGTFLVADRDALDGNGGVFRVDPATGNRTVLSSNAVGTGPGFEGPASLALAPDGSIYVGDVEDGRVLRVDPATGDRILVSGNASPPGGPDLAEPYDLTFVPPSAIVDYEAAVLENEPAGYWRFGEQLGSTALLDSSPNENDGVYLGGVTLGVAGIAGAAPDSAATYDGLNDLGRIPDDSTLDVGASFSAEGWIKRSSTSKTHALMNKGRNGLHLVVMSAGSGSQVYLRKADVTTIARSSIAGGVPADGEYHHVVATMDGSRGSARIYIDGDEAGTVQVAPTQLVQNTALPLFFGSGASTPADYDEFALYDGALSAEEVAAHYAAGVGVGLG